MADIYSSTGNLGDVVLAEEIERGVLMAVQEKAKVVPLFRQFNLAGIKSKSYSVPVWGTVTASAVAETADITSTAFTDTENSITWGRIGWMTVLSDLSERVSVANVRQGIIDAAGLGMARKMDLDLTTLFAALNGGTDMVSTVASRLTTAIFLKAIYTLESNPIHGPLRAILHPLQVDGFRTAIAASTAVPMGWGDGSVFYVRKSDSNGFVGNIYGVDVYQTTLCPTKTGSSGTTTTRTGAMFGTGDESPLAIGFWKPVGVEFQRDASRSGTEIVITAEYGVKEIRDLGGVPIGTR